MLLMLTSIGAFAQKEAETSYFVNAANGSINIDGHQIIYYLPQNYLNVNITVTQIDKVKGPYADYAEKYLNITSGIITENCSQFTIDDIKIERFSSPDTTQLYAINFIGQDYLPMIQLNADGTILACNNRSASIESKPAKPQTSIKHINKPVTFYDMGVKPFIYAKTIESNPDDSTGNVQSETEMVELTPEECAAEAAALIRKVRKRRMKLIAGITDEANNADGKAIKTMVKNLNDLEKEYLQLFVGKTSKHTHTQTITITPSKNANEQLTIGFFSDIDGFTTKQTVKKQNTYPITIKLASITNIPEIDIKSVETSAKSTSNIKYGIYYRIPSTTIISVDCDSFLHHTEQMTIAQKGYVVPLPADYLNNQKYAIEFDAETGSLKRISGN